MLTVTVSGRTYDFSHAVGGYFLAQPVGVAVGAGDTVYVLNRGIEGVPGGRPLEPNGYMARVGKYTMGTVAGDEEFVAEYGKYGATDGQFIWPTAIALDSQEKLYITDEWLNRISVYDTGDGTLLGMWGTSGEGDGELNGPSGIAIDRQDDVYVVDSRNHRVQKFTKDGKHLNKWGSLGSGDGQFDSPWGITIDHEGYVYVADHKNNRVQKFTAQGEYVTRFGTYGAGQGELDRPSGVAVDPDGDVYVCDWVNNRVQIFAPDGRFITSLVGDAQQLAKWHLQTVEANADVMKARRRVYSLEPEWRLSLPTALTFDTQKSRLLIADTQRGRLQIYNKVRGYLEPQFNL
ncbi:MAG: hypothetical protein J4F46_11010 [Dehalococcoidia bacterium]|nr:hypothetical protein [Dehalococcoidia bacterium]